MILDLISLLVSVGGVVSSLVTKLLLFGSWFMFLIRFVQMTSSYVLSCFCVGLVGLLKRNCFGDDL